MEEMTRNAGAIQEKVLREIVTKNAKTEYLRGFNLEGATDPIAAFKSQVPVITYQHIRHLIRRIADGDRSPILTAHPISDLLISSGTSGGESKLIPITEEGMDRIQFLLLQYGSLLKMRFEGSENGKVLCFMLTKAECRTAGGLTAQAVTSRVHKRLVSQLPDLLQNVYTSPGEAILCTDMFQSMYTQMLCGLYHRHQVLRIGAAFAYGLVRAVDFLRKNWEELAQDIASGTLDPRVTDPSLRECMARLLRPQQDEAAFIARECGAQSWEGIVARIWPNAKFLEAAFTGTMAQYIPTLDYYTGGLPKVSALFASSECFSAVNLDPICPPSDIAYTIMPNMAYFEFLPCSTTEASHHHLVALPDVQPGQDYEMVLTTYAGLYRYQTGDIFRVVGFHNASPKLKFIGRKGTVLSIDMEKTDETQLQAAVDGAASLLLGASVVDYTSHADTGSFPGHYVVYWELWVKDAPSEETLDQCCLAMEQCLDGMYRESRVVHKTIGPLEIRVVSSGTFEALREYGTPDGQYKVPRCVDHSHGMLQLLDSRIVSNHFSPSLPNWTPEPALKLN